MDRSPSRSQLCDRIDQQCRFASVGAGGGRTGPTSLWARWGQDHPLPLDVLPSRDVVSFAPRGHQGCSGRPRSQHPLCRDGYGARPSPSSSPPRAAPAAPAARPQPPVLAVPGGAGLWPTGGRQGWPAAGVGRLRYALARPAPGGQRGACGPTPSAGTSGSTVAGGGRTGAGRTA